MGHLFFSCGRAAADSGLAAGGGYYRDNTATDRSLSMMILEEIGAFENFRPLWRARIWALERLIACNGAAGDLRWAMLELGLAFMRSTLGTGARAVALMASNHGWSHRMAGYFATAAGDADSRVAAGGR
jgi:hypothetical protein